MRGSAAKKSPSREAAQDPMVASVARRVFRELGLKSSEPGVFDGEWRGSGPWIEKRTPIDGSLLGRVRAAAPDEVGAVVGRAAEAFARWRLVPAPVRGQLVRALGERLRRHRKALGELVTLETGKIVAEGVGEVQEMIDICDFATGLSRQIGGLTLPSERPGHRLMELWHPLGVVAVISAFNFPVAVWSWNAALAAVAGDTVVWKPSEKTPFTAIAVTRIVAAVCAEHGVDPAVFALLTGGAEAGSALAADVRVPLVSATGSVRMGRAVAEAVSVRLGRTLLELGGNNAVLVCPSADLELAARAILFSAVGTAGQRCTSARRLLVHESVREPLLERLERAYAQVRPGNPLVEGVLLGPLIDEAAVEAYEAALEAARAGGGRVLWGGGRAKVRGLARGHHVVPAVVEVPGDFAGLREETFAPLLYVTPWRTLEEGIALQNGVPQGLSSAVLTREIADMEAFLGPGGSDCGLANVNQGTSGAEIGGAFGGEKETGGGRESGSDAWKAYARRQTVVVNGSGALPLAQGIRFGGGR